MRVCRVSYSNFRNIRSASVELSDGVNVLCGMNAQGKSNILEGVYYFARGRSFRGVRERDLVMFGESLAELSLDFVRGEGDAHVRLSAALPTVGKKRLCRNGAPLRGAAEMLGAFRAVLFCPSHLSIVDGGPAERRAFLDIAIAQNSPDYVYYLSNYRRFLAERNALLKRRASGVAVSSLEWETYAAQLSRAAGAIHSLRERYCASLTEDICEYFREMTDSREEPSLRYVTHLDASERSYEEELFARLVDNIERECAVGSTLWGPHKDDIAITLNSREARLYASQGQKRSLALSMKLAEGEFSRRASGEYPVFLLDDVFSELDEARRAFIMEKLRGRQIIITSCEVSALPDNASDVTYFEVSGGEVCRVGTEVENDR